MSFVATFYTHLAAIRSQRSLTRLDVPARLAPVPRAISSSCGTCVFYDGEQPCQEAMDRDLEGIYRRTADGYETILQNEL